MKKNYKGIDEGNLFTLSSGLNLSYGIYGDENGTPIFYFGSFLQSRLSCKVFEKIDKRNNVKLIAVDRMGYGKSSSPLSLGIGYNLTQFSRDILELADFLEIENFSIIGYSAGAIYSLALLHYVNFTIKMDRINSVALISPSSPDPYQMDSNKIHHNCSTHFVQRLKNLDQLFPFGKEILFNLFRLRSTYLWPEETIADDVLRLLFTEKEVEFMKNGLHWQVYRESFMEAFRYSVDGAILDLELMSYAWPFSLLEIDNDNIFLYHGKQDTIVDVTCSYFYQHSIPKLHTKYYEDGGHGIGFNLTVHAQSIRDLLKK